ncbi:uncharacterized protein LOC119405543 [Rhipicephalus sanguineus]|uniref:uncharacterized protein LOC119405543 n=1 Tax=Rhipicephalus sanguineus TaxID=34632 RepID=UPI0020C2CDAD|nr:uncharacterized protein LOC119405543 [Rhipicephalus sanguineus]
MPSHARWLCDCYCALFSPLSPCCDCVAFVLVLSGTLSCRGVCDSAMSASNDHDVMRDGGKTTAPRFVYTAEERELLRNLVMRHRSVIENKRTDNVSKRAKDIGWEKITEEYNSQPGIRRVTVSKLRKLWDNEKTKWKKMQSEQRRNLYATGGGPSTCRPMSPSLALVGAAASHMATRLPNPYDSDGAHIGQPVLSLPPARIFESMVTGSEDTMEELLDALCPAPRPGQQKADLPKSQYMSTARDKTRQSTQHCAAIEALVHEGQSLFLNLFLLHASMYVEELSPSVIIIKVFVWCHCCMQLAPVIRFHNYTMNRVISNVVCSRRSMETHKCACTEKLQC